MSSLGKPGVSDFVALVNKPAPIPPTIGTMFEAIPFAIVAPNVLSPILMFGMFLTDSGIAPLSPFKPFFIKD